MEDKSFFKRTFATGITALQTCVKRFPVTVVFVTAFTAYLIYNISDGFNGHDKLQFALAYYLSVGSLLSLTLQLWQEEVKIRKWIIGTQALFHSLLLADAVYLYHISGEGMLTAELGIGHGACIFALALSVFFLPFWREKDDVASWNFSLQTVSAAAGAIVIGLIMSGGISLLFLSFKQLFEMDISWKWYNYILCFCSVWLSSLLFLGSIPHGTLKHDQRPQTSSFINGITHYLFLPLTASYLLVLYVYAAKILIRWELPNGWVSWLVVALMAAIIVIEFILYPVRLKELRKADERIARWLPALALPLLLLMTIGIVRRLNDYGITINRLYLATLNGWFYLVCIGLFVLRARRISWIPVSFACLLLLTSVLPVNYSSLTRQVIYQRLETAVKNTCHEQLPMNNETYGDWLSTLPYDEAERIDDQFRYMRQWFGRKSLSALANEPVYFYPGYHSESTAQADSIIAKTLSAADTATVEIASEPVRHCHYNASEYVNIPEGYSKTIYISDYNENIDQKVLEQDVIAFPLNRRSPNINDTLYINIKTLQTLNDKLGGSNKPLEIRCHSPKHKFILTGFSLRANPNTNDTLRTYKVEYKGYLFKK